MKLSQFLHNPAYIAAAAEKDFSAGRSFFGELALQYLDKNDDYRALIASNLQYFNLPCSRNDVRQTVLHTGYHYHEKFISFSKPPDFYKALFNKVSVPEDVIAEIKQNQESYEPALILCNHFGAMPLIVGLLNFYQLDISAVTRFPSEEFKQINEQKAKEIQKELACGRVKFFEPGTQLMAKMLPALEKGATFYTVIDEHTPSSPKITFLGKTITGGAGVDQIIRAIGTDKIHVYFTIMTRTEESYALDIRKVDAQHQNFIQEIFTGFENNVKKKFEQWFFLQEVHENIVK